VNTTSSHDVGYPHTNLKPSPQPKVVREGFSLYPTAACENQPPPPTMIPLRHAPTPAHRSPFYSTYLLTYLLPKALFVAYLCSGEGLFSLRPFVFKLSHRLCFLTWTAARTGILAHPLILPAPLSIIPRCRPLLL